MKVLLADALLRRKELMHKIAQLHQIKEKSCFEDVLQRIAVTDSIEEVRGKVAKVSMAEITREYDYYAGQLRRIDGRIQHTNWNTEVEVDDTAMKSFTEYNEDRDK